MAITQMDYTGGGGVSLADVGTALTNTTHTAQQSFTAEIGKSYFVYYSRGNTTVGVDTGATELGKVIITASNLYYYIGLVQATATTVTMKGSGNTVYYSDAI